MPAPLSFDYAVIRVVPRVERGEMVNAGVILFCLQRDYLAARVEVDEPRLRALWPAIDVDGGGRQHLDHQLWPEHEVPGAVASLRYSLHAPPGNIRRSGVLPVEDKTGCRKRHTQLCLMTPAPQGCLHLVGGILVVT